MDDITQLIEAARTGPPENAGGDRFQRLLRDRRVTEGTLTVLACELYHLVRSDRRSFALLASRFPSGTAGELFLEMARGEGEALRLLLDFAGALGRDEAYLRAHAPRPLAHAYPAYLTQASLYGSRSSVALALLANSEESGEQYARVADALRDHYGHDDKALGHFRYFAETPRELVDMAVAAVGEGLAAGEDPEEAVRTARTVRAYEDLFWSCLADGVEPL
ncbi:hypothetical protein [Streptomyces sp. NPDC012825]|uniref:hypothetical protein n=1 Tax=Streptomyces sp. NPDC012825 TaxID=3364851 RepID=UPI0036C9C80C